METKRQTETERHEKRDNLGSRERETLLPWNCECYAAAGVIEKRKTSTSSDDARVLTCASFNRGLLSSQTLQLAAGT